MKLKKVGIALCLSASLLALGACNSSKGSTSNQKAVKTETVAFQKDINQKNDRVWLIAKSEGFGKDSAITSAIHVKDGKIEVVTPTATLRDIDKLSDDKIWDYLVKTEKDDYKKKRQENIDSYSQELEANQNYVKTGNYPESKGVAEEEINDSEKHLEVLNKTIDFKPLQTKINVSVTTDSSGNYTNQELIDTVATTEMDVLLNHSRLKYNLESAINSPIKILNNSYLGYETKEEVEYKEYEDSAEHYMMLTRQNKSIKAIAFDKVGEKGVTEAQGND